MTSSTGPRGAMFRVAICSILGSSLIGGGVAAAGKARGPIPTVIDREEECNEAAPATYSTDGVSGSGTSVDVDVVVLLDGITRADGKRITALAAESYEPLKLRLVPRFRVVSLPGDPGGAAASVTALMKAAKDVFGGTRPQGSDLVHVLTRKDIYFQPGDGLNGMADCLGGVRYPNRAFSVSELFVTDAPGSTHGEEHGALVEAHEIGHILGGHHEYSTCAEGPAPALCTLMFPYYLGNLGPGGALSLPVNSRTFGRVERLVVRGYAEDFAAP